MLREDPHVTSLRDSTQVEVNSRLSELYPLIEERHASLPKDLNNVDRDGEDDDERDTDGMPTSQAYAARIADMFYDFATTADETSSSSA